MSYVSPITTKQNRNVMVFHAPESLYEDTKVIAEKEMVSLSAFCRMAVKSFVEDYKKHQASSEDLSEKSA